tara:strand:+ start:5270 stop:6247 length:978 start_codon:yes stop_codon:yes gene_type:complete
MVRYANIPKKYEHIDFVPPQDVADTAAKGLGYRSKAPPSQRGGLTNEEAAKEGIGSGVQRAVNLKNRNRISPKVIRQMHAFFSRHQKNKAISPEYRSTPWKDRGYVAWLIWGGDAGWRWAKKVIKQMDTADQKLKAAHQLTLNHIYNVSTRLRIALSTANARIASEGDVKEMPHRFHPVKLAPPRTKKFVGFVDFQGLEVDIEVKAGTYRRKTDSSGKEWKRYMHAHYGEIRNTRGSDGDNLDVYVGVNHDSSLVVVIHQHVPDTGAYDEDKIMLGYDSVEEAVGAYKKHYHKPGFYVDGQYTAMPIGSFWRWCKDSRNKGKRVS